jgi:Family of unknown function (DUF6572)
MISLLSTGTFRPRRGSQKTELTPVLVMTPEPPIENVDRIDIVGERHDGGVEMVLVVSGPLDGSATTLSILERKIRNYVRELKSDEFLTAYKGARARNNAIFVVSEFSVDPAVCSLIEKLKPLAREAGADLTLRDSML